MEDLVISNKPVYEIHDGFTKDTLSNINRFSKIANKNCKRCYGRGIVVMSIPNKRQWLNVCECIKD